MREQYLGGGGMIVTLFMWAAQPTADGGGTAASQDPDPLQRLRRGRRRSGLRPAGG